MHIVSLCGLAMQLLLDFLNWPRRKSSPFPSFPGLPPRARSKADPTVPASCWLVTVAYNATARGLTATVDHLIRHQKVTVPHIKNVRHRNTRVSKINTYEVVWSLDMAPPGPCSLRITTVEYADYPLRDENPDLSATNVRPDFGCPGWPGRK